MSLLETLGAMAPTAVQGIRQDGKVVTIKKGKTFWSMGDTVSDAGIIQSGLLVTTMRAVDGEYQLVGVFRPGDLMCAGLTPDSRVLMDYTALVATDILVFPMAHVSKAIYASPALADFTVKFVIDRGFRSTYLLGLLLNAPLERRLAIAMWMTGEDTRHGYRILNKKVSQGDLAKLIGSSREEVSRKRTMFEKSGYLLPTDDGEVRMSKSWKLLMTPEVDLPPDISRLFGLTK